MPEYDIASINDLKDGEMKDYSFEAGKVLLSRIDGKFYATSHLCPHYKAPLVKGTLSSDGRIMCPWHGACFRAQTGDIEDSPSIDHLQSFKVVIKGDRVWIEADPINVKAGRKVPSCTKKSSLGRDQDVIIVGGGAGGLVAAESLRELGFGGKVLIISRESYLPIDRPKLSKSIKVESGKIALRTPEQLAALKIDIMLDSQVTGVDTLQHDVILQDGSKLSFNHLILATGGDPRVLPFPGSELKNIFVMRNVEDSNMIETELSRYPNSKPDVVIIGSSFIGMEAASVLSKLANVTVVGMEKYPFERVLGTEVGKAMYDLNTLNGISLEMEQFVDKYEESISSSGKVGAVLLKGGKRLKADFVILGAGVVPKTDYLKSSGIKLDKDGGITVHPSMAIPGTNGIYAIGDIARYPYHLTKESVRIEHWDVAQNQGRVAAQSIVSSLDGVSPKPEFKSIPYFWTVQFGKSLRYCGHAHAYDEVIIQGSTTNDESGSGLAFAAFYVKGDKVLAVCSLGKDPVVSHCSELLRIGKMPTATEIKSGKDVLSIPLISPTKYVKKVRVSTSDYNIVAFVIIPLALMAASAFIVYLRQQ